MAYFFLHAYDKLLVIDFHDLIHKWENYPLQYGMLNNGLFFTLNAASNSIISYREIFRSTTHLRIQWKSIQNRLYPYLPDTFELESSCRLLCDEKAYFTEHLKVVNSTVTSKDLSNLRPGTICRLALLARYNPASLDPGTILEATTFFAGIYRSVN